MEKSRFPSLIFWVAVRSLSRVRDNAPVDPPGKPKCCDRKDYNHSRQHIPNQLLNLGQCLKHTGNHKEAAFPVFAGLKINLLYQSFYFAAQVKSVTAVTAVRPYNPAVC